MSILMSRLIELIDCSYSHIQDGVTTTVKSGGGYLKSVTINTKGADTITLYDSADASGTVIAEIAPNAGPVTLDYGIHFNTGLTIVSPAASDLTVAYR